MLRRSPLKRGGPLKPGATRLTTRTQLRVTGQVTRRRHRKARAADVGEAHTAAIEAEHKAALVGLGCMVCRRLFNITDSQVELHHRREGGWGKGDYTTLIPLCYEHHRGDSGVHGMGTKGFAKHYGFTQQDLLDDALALLAQVTRGCR
jgi:hypothetical protein